MTDIPLKELVRMPVGTMTTYILPTGEEPAFVKKLDTYASRCGAKVERQVWICINTRTDAVIRMVQCKVRRQGRDPQKRGRKPQQKARKK